MITYKHLSGSSSVMTAYIENQQHTVLHQDGTTDSVGYYMDRAPSRWVGTVAESYGSGPVVPDDLVNLLDGITPDGENITHRGNRSKDRRKGTDLTISAPKSISIMALAVGDDRLVQAHAEAVAVAAKYIENEMVYARSGAGGHISEFGVSVAMADFRHEDSRAINGVADPQLHDHLILPNMCQHNTGNLKSEWSAVKIDFGHDNEKLYTLDAIYKAELAKRVVDLGYKVRQTKVGFEIANISDEQMARFSRRREAIDENLMESGITRETATSKERDRANLMTRGNKTQLSKEAQLKEWKERIEGLGLESVKEKAESTPEPDTAISAEDAIKAAVRHFSETQTTFSKAKLIQETLRLGIGHITQDEVEKAIQDGNAGLLEAGKAQGLKSEAYTSMDILYREAEILKTAEAGKTNGCALRDAQSAQDYIASYEAGHSTPDREFKFGEGQAKAIEHALTTRDRHIAIVGAAGAGKTTAMAAIVKEYEDQGYEVIGLAPTAKAAIELRSAGCETKTLASILAKPQERTGKPRLYVMDEAGMVGADDFDKFLKLSDIEDARSILVGDPRQLSAVGAGKPYAQMIESESIKATHIDEIQRQKANPKLLNIATDFATGESRRAVDSVKEFIVEVPVAKGQDRAEVLARRATETFTALSPEERENTLVLVGTNETRGKVNQLIRQEFIKEQTVSADGVNFTVLDKVKLSAEKATHISEYEAGMVVQFEKDYPPKNKNSKDSQIQAERKSQWDVVSTQSDRVVLHDRQTGKKITWNPADSKSAVSVYTAREIELGTGDKVFFRQNDKDKQIVNGTQATVMGMIDQHIQLKLDDDREIQLDRRRSEVIDYAYARTVHASQGATVDRVIVVGEAGRTATTETAYVACTRERKDLTIITDNTDKLCSSWKKEADKRHSMDAASQTSIPENLKKARKEAREKVGNVGDLIRKIQQRRAQQGIKI